MVETLLPSLYVLQNLKYLGIWGEVSILFWSQNNKIDIF